MLDDFCLLENEKAKNEGTSSTKEVVTYYAYDFIYLPIDFRYVCNYLNSCCSVTYIYILLMKFLDQCCN